MYLCCYLFVISLKGGRRFGEDLFLAGTRARARATGRILDSKVRKAGGAGSQVHTPHRLVQRLAYIAQVLLVG